MRAFSHIVVPVDFTERNRIALAKAMEIARPAAGRIMLLHIIEEVPYADDDQIDKFYAMLRRQAEQKMHELVEGFRKDRGAVELTTAIMVGRRGPEIVRYAMEKHADLVVMSSHAIRTDDLTGGWATLSYQVSIICPCSVLLVK
jgi:nucleotide-binding universal stress UspA family protein